MSTRMCRSLKGILLGGLLFGWANTPGAETPTSAALMEKYGLSPGMQITKENNAQLIKDLIPEATYRRLAAGEINFTIGKLESPDIFQKVFTKEYYTASERNAGKYDVDADGGIIDKVTGKRPWPMPYGRPFNIDLTEDPKKVGVKIQWNSWSLPGTYNELDNNGLAALFGTSIWGTPDRGTTLQSVRQYIDFRQDPIQIERPLSFQDLQLILGPADAFGNATLTWRWIDPKKWDSVWSYSPSVRRVRRRTAANRSDSTLGLEYTQDDSNMYNGKTEMFEWKYIAERALLMPFPHLATQGLDDVTTYVVSKGTSSVHPQKGPHAFDGGFKKATYGYEESPQRYASFWTTDVLWVPVWGYVVEGMPKDPNYNLGRQIFWYSADTFAGVWKLAYNRAGEYWRTSVGFSTYVLYEGGDKPRGGVKNIGLVLIDERVNRGTVALEARADPGEGEKKGGGHTYHLGFDPELLSVSKFLEYGK